MLELTETTLSPLGEKLADSIRAFANALDKQIALSNTKCEKLGMEKGSMPDDAVISKCVTELVRHLDRHVTTYKVLQEEVDIFKVSAWLGMMLWHHSGRSFNLLDLLSVLNLQLDQVGRKLPFDFLRKAARMAAYDKCKDRDDLAVGMNGIYLTFRACYKLEMLSPTNP